MECVANSFVTAIVWCENECPINRGSTPHISWPLDTTGSARIIPAALKPRWRNWQTRYFEVVVPQGVQVRVLSWAIKRLLAGFLLTFFAWRSHPSSASTPSTSFVCCLTTDRSIWNWDFSANPSGPRMIGGDLSSRLWRDTPCRAADRSDAPADRIQATGIRDLADRRESGRRISGRPDPPRSCRQDPAADRGRDS